MISRQDAAPTRKELQHEPIFYNSGGIALRQGNMAKFTCHINFKMETMGAAGECRPSP
jgi:hypothetical protein